MANTYGEVSDAVKAEIAGAKPVAVPEINKNTNTNGNQSEAKPPPKEEGPKESSFRDEGSNLRAVTLDQDIRDLIANKLFHRVDALTNGSTKENQPRSTIERALGTHGESLIKKLEGGEALTRDEIALAWYAIRDEMILKAGAGGKIITETITPEKRAWLKNIPVLKLFHGEKQVDTTLATGDHRLGNDLTKDQAIHDSELTELNNLRIDMEQSFFPGGIEDPLWGRDFASSAPFALGEGKTGHKMLDRIVENTKDIMARKHEGKPFDQLWRENPTAALEVMHEATQIGYTEFASQSALEILKNEGPAKTIQEQGSTIEAHATKLATDKKADDITKLTGEQETTKTAHDTVKTEHDTFVKDLKDTEEQIKKAEVAVIRTTQNETNLKPRYESALTVAQYNTARAIDALNDPSNTPMREIVDKAGKRYVPNEQYDKCLATLAGCQAKEQEAQDRLNKLSDDKILAQTALDEAKLRKIDIESAPGFTIKKTALEAELKAKKDKFDKATKELKKKQDEATDPEKVKASKEKAGALRTWKKVGENYSRIMELRFNQKDARFDEYTLDKLASVKLTSSGELEGAEKIREHIFKVIQGGEYDATLARKMLSDEAIAKAIVAIYKVNIDTIQDGQSLQNLFDDISNNKNRLDRASPTRKKTIQTEIHRLEGVALQRVLPNLTQSKFLAGDLLNFMVTQGINSATNGEAFLEIDDNFTRPRSGVERQTENLAPSDGRTEIDITNRQFLWEGTVDNYNPFGIAPSARPLDMRVRQTLTRNQDAVVIETRSTPQFIQSLPDVYGGTVPDSLKFFYDKNGRKRTDENWMRTRPEWVRLGEEKDPSVDQILTFLDVEVPDISDRITSSTVDSVLRLTPVERKTLLAGIPATIDIAGYSLRFNNDGNFYMNDPVIGREVELGQFYKGLSDEYMQNNNLQPLSDADRETLGDIVKLVQTTLGREILKAQQKR